MLGNLVTLPTYKRQGAGSALTSWPFGRADEEGVVVYLDTDEVGGARAMYERLGFGKVDEVSTSRVPLRTQDAQSGCRGPLRMEG